MFAMDNLLIQFNPESDYGLQVNEEDINKCEKCFKDIMLNDYYFEDENEKEDVEFDLCDRLAIEISKQIDSCSNCGHGLDMKDLQASLQVHFKENDEWESKFDSYHIYTTLENLITEFTIVEDRYYDDIIDCLRCPHCGNGGGARSKDTMYDEKFNRDTEVYTKNEVHSFNYEFYGEDFDEIKSHVRFIDESISIEKLIDFRDQYVRNPIFIREHEVFDILYQKIEMLFSKKQCLELYRSKRFFRAQINTLGNELYSEERMWNAPDYLPSQGRYNSHGQTTLYCSNDEGVLKKELPLGNNEEYNYAEFRVLRTLTLMPIDTIFEDFGEFIYDNGNYKGQMSKKYVLTNIIEMICKRIGFNGLAYTSVKDPMYVNYNIFNFERDVDIEMIYIYKIA
ncbi:hypothetical protein [Paenibacillus auburnensis]|uniref:hypothetical protein n=1 Tax=Paenibacillus auburnensis TaxID=2905649 RepID=UPI001F3E0DD7|nr:hypothetical protein [Paenibacillus auburnensis]